MKRQIIKIDENKCNGCGLCVSACHEGAIKLVNGKAKLVRDDYCDGLGDCLPACQMGAISFEVREAANYNESAVLASKLHTQNDSVTVDGLGKTSDKSEQTKIAQTENDSSQRAYGQHFSSKSEKNEQNFSSKSAKLPCGCPSTYAKSLERNQEKIDLGSSTFGNENQRASTESMLRQWPVQIKLVPTNAPYFDNANLLIAADCTAYAYANFHSEFIKNHICIIGCPKLDNISYTEKLTEIIRQNNIKSIKIVRMKVPCCAALAEAAKQAVKNSGKFLPWGVVIISPNGELVD